MRCFWNWLAGKILKEKYSDGVIREDRIKVPSRISSSPESIPVNIGFELTVAEGGIVMRTTTFKDHGDYPERKMYLLHDSDHENLSLEIGRIVALHILKL